MTMAFPLKRTRLTLGDLHKAEALIAVKTTDNLSFDEFCIVEQAIYNQRTDINKAVHSTLYVRLHEVKAIRTTFDFAWLLACAQLDFNISGLLPVGYLKPQ